MNEGDLERLLRERDDLKEHCHRLEAVVKQIVFPPGHYYSPLVDFADPLIIRTTTDRLQAPVPKDIDLNLPKMRLLAERLASHLSSWPFTAKKIDRNRFYYDNPFFGVYDAAVYFSMLLEYRPRRVVEVGCGYSSRLLLDTRNSFFDPDRLSLTLIDPALGQIRGELNCESTSGVRMLERRVQDAPFEVFEELGDDDFLFIDSSHVCKTGSDVNHYLFEIFPRLRQGVVVHIHDILYPFEYPASWVLDEKRSWNEAYVVRSFLQNNHAFEILMWNNFFYHKANESLRALMPLCIENEGGSLWLRKRE
jgi:hypothetical protein